MTRRNYRKTTDIGARAYMSSSRFKLSKYPKNRLKILFFLKRRVAVRKWADFFFAPKNFELDLSKKALFARVFQLYYQIKMNQKSEFVIFEVFLCSFRFYVYLAQTGSEPRARIP